MLNNDKDNIFKGFHGRFNSDIVFKRRYGKTILCCYPKGKKIKWTENQKETRVNFKLASCFAKNALADPEKRKFFLEREHDGVNAYNLAISSYLTKPVVNSISVRKSRRSDQYLVQVRATDAFAITKVWIDLFDSSGEIMERMYATQFRHTGRWICQVSIARLGTTALIRARAENDAWHSAEMVYRISPEEASKWMPHSCSRDAG